MKHSEYLRKHLIQAFAESLHAILRPLSIAGVVLAAGDAGAANLYWDGNGTISGAGTAPSGTWGDAGLGSNFWNTDATGDAAGAFQDFTTADDTAFFSAGPTVAGSGTGTYGITVDGVQSISKLTFQSIGAITLSGGAINLGSGGLSTKRTVVSSNDRLAVTINSDIVLQAAQTWVADGTSATGTTTVNGNISGTGNLSLNQNGNRAFTLSGSINHAGSITAIGTNATGVLISGNIGSNVTTVGVTNSAPLILTGSNNYSGSTLITAGNSMNARIRVGNNNALPTATTVVLNASQSNSIASLDLGNGVNSFNATISAIVTSGTRVTSDRVTNSSTGTGTGTLTVSSNGPDTSFDGVLQDGATAKLAFEKAGSNAVTLGGTNYYSGGTTVSAGTLYANGSAIAASSLAANTTNGSATVTVASSAGLKVGQVITGVGIPANAFITSIVNGTTIIISQAATVTGAPTLSFAAGSALGTGAVTVNAGATLAGGGTIAGPVSVAGVLAPGNSPGILTVENDVTLSDGSAFAAELNGAVAGSEYDQLAVGGTGILSLSGNNNLQLTLGYAPAVGDQFTIGLIQGVDSSSTLGVFEMLNGVATDLSQGSIFSFGGFNFAISYQAEGNVFAAGGNNIMLEVQAIPEPSLLAMLTAGLGMLITFRRRRRR